MVWNYRTEIICSHATVSVIWNRLVLKLAIYNASSIKQINKTEHHTRVPHMHVSLESFESYLACYPRPRVLLFLGYLGSGRCLSGLIYLPIFCFSFSSYYRFCYCFYHLMLHSFSRISSKSVYYPFPIWGDDRLTHAM